MIVGRIEWEVFRTYKTKRRSTNSWWRVGCVFDGLTYNNRNKIFHFLGGPRDEFYPFPPYCIPIWRSWGCRCWTYRFGDLLDWYSRLPSHGNGATYSLPRVVVRRGYRSFLLGGGRISSFFEGGARHTCGFWTTSPHQHDEYRYNTHNNNNDYNNDLSNPHTHTRSWSTQYIYIGCCELSHFTHSHTIPHWTNLERKNEIYIYIYIRLYNLPHIGSHHHHHIVTTHSPTHHSNIDTYYYYYYISTTKTHHGCLSESNHDTSESSTILRILLLFETILLTSDLGHDDTR